MTIHTLTEDLAKLERTFNEMSSLAGGGFTSFVVDILLRRSMNKKWSYLKEAMNAYNHLEELLLKNRLTIEKAREMVEELKGLVSRLEDRIRYFQRVLQNFQELESQGIFLPRARRLCEEMLALTARFHDRVLQNLEDLEDIPELSRRLQTESKEPGRPWREVWQELES